MVFECDTGPERSELPGFSGGDRVRSACEQSQHRSSKWQKRKRRIRIEAVRASTISTNALRADCSFLPAPQSTAGGATTLDTLESKIEKFLLSLSAKVDVLCRYISGIQNVSETWQPPCMWQKDSRDAEAVWFPIGRHGIWEALHSELVPGASAGQNKLNPDATEFFPNGCAESITKAVSHEQDNFDAKIDRSTLLAYRHTRDEDNAKRDFGGLTCQGTKYEHCLTDELNDLIQKLESIWKEVQDSAHVLSEQVAAVNPNILDALDPEDMIEGRKQGEINMASDQAGKTSPACHKCGEADCFCWQLFCRGCNRPAPDCCCTNCIVRRKRCRRCFALEDSTSPFDKNYSDFYTPLPSHFSCPGCGSELEDPDFMQFYRIESAKTCFKCGRIGYHGMSTCEWGLACMAELPFHKSCLNMWRGLRVCDSCLNCGIHDQVDSGWPVFDHEEQLVFQSWYSGVLDAARASINRAKVNNEEEEPGAEDAQVLELYVEDMKSMEFMRQEAWRFHHARAEMKIRK